MKTSSKIVAGTILFLLISLVVYRALNPQKISDPQVIAAQFNSAISSANAKDVAGLLNVVSDDYTDSNIQNREQLAIVLRRALSGSQNVNVNAAPPTITVAGDTATTSGLISVTVDGSSLLNQVITLSWEKQSTRRYLIFPDHIWRVVHSNYNGSAIAD